MLPANYYASRMAYQEYSNRIISRDDPSTRWLLCLKEGIHRMFKSNNSPRWSLKVDKSKGCVKNRSLYFWCFTFVNGPVFQNIWGDFSWSPVQREGDGSIVNNISEKVWLTLHTIDFIEGYWQCYAMKNCVKEFSFVITRTCQVAVEH